jgi:hypothetical protein
MVGNEEISNRINITLEKIIVDFPELADMLPASKEKLTYLEVLGLIKKYNPEDWNRFLGMLYKGVDEIKKIFN